MAKGGGNKSFVLRVDAATMEALEQWADDEFRSINGQLQCQMCIRDRLQWIIADALRRSGRLKKSAAAAADATAGADADKDMSSVVDETAAKE